MKALITGSNGFIGKNIKVHLKEKEIDNISFSKDMTLDQLSELLTNVDFVFHLAGVNRPENQEEFKSGNKEFTKKLCDAIRSTGRKIPVIYSSSTKVESNDLYGNSKKAAENALIELHKDTGSPVYIYRLPNVFGKWSRPNYNSVVATFCFNIANDKEIKVSDPSAVVTLVYIDDVISDFIRLFKDRFDGLHYIDIKTTYKISVGDLAKLISSFKKDRNCMTIDTVGIGLKRALYSTYLSFLRPEQISHSLPINEDDRGRFVEMLKTKGSGQFSFFTAYPGVTRGGHYHHTKNEKFLVIKGKAQFRFRHIITNETFEIFTDGTVPQVVETVPGWAHDITNISDDEMIVMLWANEVFDKKQPDTFSYRGI